MSGYLQGHDLADDFLKALSSSNGSVIASVDDLIAGTDDPRRAEVYADLKELLLKKVIG